LFDQHQSHQSGRRDHSAPLWTLLMFEAFLRNVLHAQQPVAVSNDLKNFRVA